MASASVAVPRDFLQIVEVQREMEPLCDQSVFPVLDESSTSTSTSTMTMTMTTKGQEEGYSTHQAPQEQLPQAASPNENENNNHHAAAVPKQPPPRFYSTPLDPHDPDSTPVNLYGLEQRHECYVPRRRLWALPSSRPRSMIVVGEGNEKSYGASATDGPGPGPGPRRFISKKSSPLSSSSSSSTRAGILNEKHNAGENANTERASTITRSSTIRPKSNPEAIPSSLSSLSTSSLSSSSTARATTTTTRATTPTTDTLQHPSSSSSSLALCHSDHHPEPSKVPKRTNTAPLLNTPNATSTFTSTSTPRPARTLTRSTQLNKSRRQSILFWRKDDSDDHEEQHHQHHHPHLDTCDGDNKDKNKDNAKENTNDNNNPRFPNEKKEEKKKESKGRRLHRSLTMMTLPSLRRR